MSAVRPIAGLVLTLALAGWRPAAAADPTPYPADPSNRDAVEAWINQALDVGSYLATGWSPNALFFAAVGQINLDDYPVVRTAVWTEVINPDAALAAGWRSSVAQVSFDCRARRYHELSRTLYALPSRAGAPRRGAVEPHWVTPAADTTMATTLDEVCYRAKATMDLYVAHRAPPPAAPARKP